jgi:putative transcriptional regulator
MTQEQFAAAYLIPVGTLRDWEQRRKMPDAPARALLWAIEGDPQGLAKVLGRKVA